MCFNFFWIVVRLCECLVFLVKWILFVGFFVNVSVCYGWSGGMVDVGDLKFFGCKVVWV